VWWCPTGYFAHLPIYAAGADGKWCSDSIILSYIPTVSTLLTVRKGYVQIKKQDIKALVAAIPQLFLSLWTELASTVEEVKIVKAALLQGTLISDLGTDSTVDGVAGGVTASTLLERLPKAMILHLACHGRQDLVNPLHSGFMMSDKILTIKTLMQVLLPWAFMAFMSACETAKGNQVSVGNWQC
jgi:CHAT domain-containing protein